jgi:hypothetical protein
MSAIPTFYSRGVTKLPGYVLRWGARVSFGLFLLVFAYSGGELHGEAELFKLTDEEPPASFWLIFPFEIAGPEFVVHGFVVQATSGRTTCVPSAFGAASRWRQQRGLLSGLRVTGGCISKPDGASGVIDAVPDSATCGDFVLPLLQDDLVHPA